MPENTRNEKSAWATKYPYGRGFVSESGHEFHVDDTEGEERVRWAHKDGSYTEVSKGGRVVTVNVGNKQEYSRSGVTFTVDHNGDVKMHGHQRLLVAGGSHIEISGDANIVTGGDSLNVVGGSMKASVAGSAYLGVKGDMNTNITGNHSMNISGNMSMNIKGTTSINSSGNMSLASSGNVLIQQPGTPSAAGVIASQSGGETST